MRLWIVLTILGHVQGTWGPQPPDANIAECSVRAEAFQTAIRYGMWTHPDAVLPGHPSPHEVSIRCFTADTRPALGGPSP